MIRTSLSVSIDCDADRPQLGLQQSHLGCVGTTGRCKTQAAAMDRATLEGFKQHKDGKHHLCRACAALNPDAVKA